MTSWDWPEHLPFTIASIARALSRAAAAKAEKFEKAEKAAAAKAEKKA